MIYILAILLTCAFYFFRAGTFAGDMLRYYSGFMGAISLLLFFYANSLPYDGSSRNANLTFLPLLGGLLYLPFTFQMMFRLGLPILETGLGLFISFIAYKITDGIIISIFFGALAMWLISLKTLKIVPVKLALSNYTNLFKRIS
ncbi:hypothetical protein [Acinetobacter radioresistens]|uniref:hypothetical protein n=1 Tax=Acinetobacter radioresistens TaxID=40216 RepID=UPI0009466A1D|nr:hypothetical protein [Acinetobacter radioresistens]